MVLLALGQMISFIDRTSLSSALADHGFIHQFGLSSIERGWLSSAFFWSYGLMQMPMGWLVDRYGVQWPYAICLLLWCVAAAATGLVSTLPALIMMRLLIGLAEGVVLPATYRYLANRFAEHQRGTALGVFSIGGKMGPALGGLIGAWLIVHHSWQAMFIATGLAGLLWLWLWLWPWLKQVHNDYGIAIVAALAGWAAERLIARGHDPLRVRKSFIQQPGADQADPDPAASGRPQHRPAASGDQPGGRHLGQPVRLAAAYQRQLRAADASHLRVNATGRHQHARAVPPPVGAQNAA